MSDPFSDEIVEAVRKAKAANDTGRFYKMLPTDDGGESYHMECTLCKEIGNMLSQEEFPHADNCPLKDA